MSAHAELGRARDELVKAASRLIVGIDNGDTYDELKALLDALEDVDAAVDAVGLALHLTGRL